MYFDFPAMSVNQRYITMTSTVLPRPIAWVLTDNGDESVNLAPFSYFNAVCSDPPLLMFSAGLKPNGDNKDTVVNMVERKKCVIHIPHAEQAATVTETSRTLDHGDSELGYVDLSLTEFEGFELPRLKECRVAYACDLYEIQEIGNGPQSLVFAEVKSLYVDDSAVGQDAKGRPKIDAEKVNPLARLGSSEYAVQGRVINIPRPK